uniref:hypothetical protein n=1 Tax=Vibrio sp. TaxID=678 RepID=UPI00311ECE8C
YKSRHMEAAVQRYGSNSNFKYINDVVQNHLHEFEACDMVVCLETLEHIPESDVVRIVENLGKARPKALLFSVPNDIGPIVFVKNFGSMLIGWKRHKEYSWLETLQASLYMHTTEHKGFDWRWLAQTIRQNMIIKKIHRSPVNFIPCTLSPSIIFECVSDPHDGNE